MKLALEVELPDDVLTHVATEAVAAAFHAPEYRGGEGGHLYRALVQAGTEAVAAIDFSPLIQARVAERLPMLLDDVLEGALRKAIKAKVKEMGERGTLFEKVDTT